MSEQFEVQMWQPPLDQWQREGTWLQLHNPFTTVEEAELEMLDRIGPEYPKGRIVKIVTTRTVIARAGYAGSTDEEVIEAIKRGILP